MPGLVPGIHVFLREQENVDGRAQASGSDAVLRTAMPSHDELRGLCPYFTASNSTSNISVAFGGMAPPAPRAP